MGEFAVDAASEVISWRSSIFAWLRRDRMAQMGLALIAVIVVPVVLAPLVAPASPLAQHPGFELQPPSTRFPLGTDELGRDLLSRVLYGGRVSIWVGIISVIIGVIIGSLVGLIGGYIRGFADSILMRTADVILAFPAILIGITVAAVRGPGVENIAFAVAIINIPIFARLARSLAINIKPRPFVDAAKAAGGRAPWLIVRHILPHAISPIMVQVGVSIAAAVLLEAGLSFLGLGVVPPEPSWGAMLNTSRPYLRLAPWYAIAPGAVATILLLGVNLFIDALRNFSEE